MKVDDIPDHADLEEVLAPLWLYYEDGSYESESGWYCGGHAPLDGEGHTHSEVSREIYTHIDSTEELQCCICGKHPRKKPKLTTKAPPEEKQTATTKPNAAIPSLTACLLPWSDVKVAIPCGDDWSVKALWRASDKGRLDLPQGWALIATDGTGAGDYVAIFRVTARFDWLMHDGVAARKTINAINMRRKKPNCMDCGRSDVGLRRLPKRIAGKNTICCDCYVGDLKGTAARFHQLPATLQFFRG